MTAVRILSEYGASSGAWQTKQDDPTTFWRRAGLLERKFDNAAQQKGQSDTFLQLNFDFPTLEAANVFFARLPLAWAALRAKHPLLSATMHDSVSVTENGADQGSLPSPREFRYHHPGSDEEALKMAADTLLLDEMGNGEEVVVKMAKVLKEKVLNGPRVFLDQEGCLARLLVFRAKDNGPHGLCLVIAHCISDGLSVFQLVHELFAFISLATLPTPESTLLTRSLDTFLSNPNTPTPPNPSLSPVIQSWHLTLPPALPLSTEALFPTLPLPSSPPTPNSPQSTASTSTVARDRWFWAVQRVLIINSHLRHARGRALPRLPPSEPPLQPNTSWPVLRFSKEITSRLVKLSKSNSVSPNMLLYSILSIALSNIFATVHPDAATDYKPNVLFSPISLRRFFLPAFPEASSDLAIRITFRSITLPSFPQSGENVSYLRWTALKGAKLAARQFALAMNPHPTVRNHLFARAIYRIQDRLLTALGVNTNPFFEPGASLTASMIGDVDRVLNTHYSLPSKSPSQVLLSNALIGTRMHKGEGSLLELFTWDSRIHLCLGFDDTTFDKQMIEKLLQEVEKIGTKLADIVLLED